VLLKKEHQEFREKIRAFAEEKIAPNAAKIDLEQRFPVEYLKPMAGIGLMGMVVPKEYGGSQVDTVSYSIAVEELSRVCGSTGITIAAHNSLGTFPIYKFGTEEQRKKYLPRGTGGGELLAFGLTEPEAGSDAGATKSTAVKKDDHWILNGTKCFITSATYAYASIATARTSDEPGVKGISSFILEKGWEGYEIGKKENKMGLRGSDTSTMHFTDIKVPLENQLGNLGEGFKQFMITLDGGRISIGAMALGLAQGAYECALKYAATKRNGEMVGATQAIQWKLADMATEIEAARYMVYGASQMKDAGVKFSKESAMAKLYAAEVGNRTCYQAIQILGEVGCLTGAFPAERMYRDVKLCEIGEGTSEVQRIVVAREVLKSVV